MDLFSVLGFAFISILILIFIIALKHLYNYDNGKKLNIPGPWSLPIIGYILFLGKNPHLKMAALVKKYGSIYSLKLGNQSVVVLNGYKTIKAALNDRATEFAGRPQAYIFKLLDRGDEGVGLVDFGPEWKIRRKITTKALNKFSSVKDFTFHKTLTECCQSLAESMAESDEKGYHPTDDILSAVGQVISSICFGKQFEKYDKDYLALMQRMSEFSRVANGVNIVNYLPWTKIFFKNIIEKAKERDIGMKDLCMRLLRPHIETYRKGCLRDTADALILSAEELREEGEETAVIDDKQILAIVHELMSAGFATVATTLRWGVLLLTLHPEVQDLAQAEIDKVITDNRYPVLEDKGQLPYTEATILEIQRFASIVALGVTRSTTKDIEFEGYFIPKDTVVIPNLWSLHYDSKVWNEPEKFKPSRFLNYFGDSINPVVAEKIMPFGAGRRRCAGEILGRMELFLFITTLLQRCRFHEIPGKKLNIKNYKFGLVLNPNPYYIKVTKRITTKEEEL